MGRSFLARASLIFNRVESRWETLATQRRIATFLTLVFLIGILVIELNRRGWLTPDLARHLPVKHFDAIIWAFTLLLVVEVVSLVLALAQSVSTAVGKQLEIMSLILIRQSFKELSSFPEPIEWSDGVRDQVLYILSDAFGALAIFAVLLVFVGQQRHLPIGRDDGERSGFIAAKKLIAMVLLGSLAITGAVVVWSWFASAAGAGNRPPAHDFFEVFYTLLIFADVLIVLISLRTTVAYPVIFRYFGFAVATVLVRLALTAPRFVDAGLGVTAAVFAVALTWVYNRAVTPIERPT